MRNICLVLAIVVLSFATARGQLVIGATPAVELSAGYSRLFIGVPSNERITKDGEYVDLDVAARVLNLNVPLQLGAGVSAAGYFRSDRVDVVDDSGFFFRDRLDSDLGLYTLEARAAMPFRFGRDSGFFLNPRLGAGLVVDNYNIDHAQDTGGGTLFFTDRHTGAAFGIRPTIEAGFFAPGWAAGAQVSYMAAWGDFGQLASTAQEVQAGLFLRWSR